MLINRCLPAVFALSFSVASHAHQVWIEQDATSAKLYFGEFYENLHEVSPGYLDKITQPAATHLSASGAHEAKIMKKEGAFEIAARANPGESLIVQDAHYPVAERKEGEQVVRSAWTPAARWLGGFAAQAPRLALDIVPTGATGEFRVYFHDQPLPEAKVEVTAASGWGRELKAGKDGVFKLTLPWKGVYALLVRHTEAAAGERDGEKYTAASYATTTTFLLREGLTPPSPPPPAAPNR
jgi:uncharacterized GH25 family protein